MAVVSVRLNKEEDRILKKLSEHYGLDKSALIKKSLFEMYENMVDLEFIEGFEKREKRGKVSFVKAEDIIS